MTDMGLVLKEIAGKMRFVRPSEETVTASVIRYDNSACRPDCEICGGSGRVRLDHPVGHPRFGKTEFCPNVDLFSHYAKNIGLDAKDQGKSWGDIEYREDTNVSKAVDAVREVLDRGYGWVFLHGDYGLAKTLILKIAIAEFIRAHHEMAAYVRMADVLEDLRRAYSDSKDVAKQEDAIQRLDRWASLPLLCIDEFDKVRPTEFANEKRFLLMDRRYEDAFKDRDTPTVTLIASNVGPEQFDGYLASRINDGRFKIIKMTGTDYRPLMDL